jgi:aspartyl-tRNA(Asn)/glutamyl-tRNA(Gln) amidotransferase subunit A
MEELARALGGEAFTLGLPAAFAQAAELRETINFAEMAACYDVYERRGRDGLSGILRDAMGKGRAVSSRDLHAALESSRVLAAALDDILSRCDALLCPASLGPAPRGLGSTGSAICNGLWTLCGVPVVSLPVFRSADGLPMGLQVVGRRGEDGPLLRTARWLWDRLIPRRGGAPGRGRRPMSL